MARLFHALCLTLIILISVLPSPASSTVCVLVFSTAMVVWKGDLSVHGSGSTLGEKLLRSECDGGYTYKPAGSNGATLMASAIAQLQRRGLHLNSSSTTTLSPVDTLGRQWVVTTLVLEGQLTAGRSGLSATEL